MKQLYIVDGEIEFLDLIQGTGIGDKVEIKIFTSIKNFFKKLEQKPPNLVFIDLGISDADEFILFDILKFCTEVNNIPIYLTFRDKEIAAQYKNLRHQPNEYLKKPVSENKIKQIILENEKIKIISKPSEEQLTKSDTFDKTDLLFDALIENAIDESNKNIKEDKGIFTVHDGEINDFAEEVEKLKSINKKQSKEIKDLNNQISKIENDYKRELDDLKELSTKDKIINLDKIDELEKQIEESENSVKSKISKIKEKNKTQCDKYQKEIKELELNNNNFQVKEEEYIDRINTLSTQIENNCASLQELKTLEENQRITIDQKELEIKKLSESNKKYKDKESILISSIEKQKEEIKEKENILRNSDKINKKTQRFIDQFKDLNKKLEDIL